MLIVKWQTQRWNRPECVEFQIDRIHRIVLWHQQLDGNCHFIDIFLCQEAWMADADTIYQWGLVFLRT